MKFFPRLLRWPILGLALLVLPTITVRGQDAPDAAPATQPAEANSFMRFVPDGDGGSLQTANVSFTNDAGVTVHLVAAVHIADKAYYDGLNKTFKGYDAVLYEMVKPKGSGLPVPNQAPTNGITMVQRMMKDMLGLDFQLDDIDYRADNFVHADLDAETFEKMEADKGESILGLMIQQAIKTMGKEQKADAPDIGLSDLLDAFSGDNGGRKLKLLLAAQFGDIEDEFSGATVLITDRNRAALHVMRDEMAAGKKNMAIFYGAGHMKDMSERLEDMGFKRGDTAWEKAWDIPAKPAEPDNSDNN
jgi:Ca2+-binding RTX toxin-like protein